MSQLINKILKEATKNDDSFFRPKDISKREKEYRRQVLYEMEIGLKNIKLIYKNKDKSATWKWKKKAEKIFIQEFSKLHLNSEEIENYILLLNSDDKVLAFVDLKKRFFGVSYKEIWENIENEFDDVAATSRFVNELQDKYFHLEDFFCFYKEWANKEWRNKKI